MTEDKHPPCLALPWWLAPSLALATAVAAPPPPPPSNIQHLSACLPTLTQTQSTLYTTYTYTRAIYPGVPHLISAPSTLSGIPETGARSRSADSSWSRRAPAPSDVSWGQLACLVRLAARILFRTATPPPFHEQMMLLAGATAQSPASSPPPPPPPPLPPRFSLLDLLVAPSSSSSA